MIRQPPKSTLFPNSTLFRSGLPTPATYRVQSSTIADNSAQAGAGVFINNNDLPLTVENTTISGNRASERGRSEEHTAELQSRQYLVCRLLLEKKKNLLCMIR